MFMVMMIKIIHTRKFFYQNNFIEVEKIAGKSLEESRIIKLSKDEKFVQLAKKLSKSLNWLVRYFEENLF